MREMILNRKKRLSFTLFTFLFAMTALVTFENSLVNEADSVRLIYLIGIFVLAAGCEFIDTTLGMGYGTSLTPLLLLAGFQPMDVIPSILASELITGGFASYMHHRDGNFNFKGDNVMKKLVPGLVALSFIGALVAVSFSFKLTGDAWKYVIVGIICSMGLIILLQKKSRAGVRPLRMLLIGTVAAFNKGISGGGYGPLMTAGQITSGISSRNAVAVTSFTEFFTSLVAFSAFVFAGARLNYGLMLPLVFGAVCAVPIATLTVKRVKEDKLRRMIGVLTISLGILIVVKALLS